jgi:hypothetical protein
LKRFSDVGVEFDNCIRASGPLSFSVESLQISG